MAVQLGRLSMWLATLAADRPLTFLDHRLRTGDSLVGAAPWDILRQRAPGSRRRARSSPLPLFEDDGLDRALGAAVAVRGELALGPGDTLEQVRAKERALAHLQQDDSGLTRWKRVADAWCAVWFQDATGRARSRTSFPDVMASIFQRPDGAAGAAAATADDRRRVRRRGAPVLSLAARVPRALSRRSRDARSMRRVSTPCSAIRPGKCSVATTAPRGPAPRRASQDPASPTSCADPGSTGFRATATSTCISCLSSARWRCCGRTAGLGLVLPSGFAIDHGCASLRRAVFERTRVDTLHGFENRDGLFPIHRGLKFLLTTAHARSANDHRAGALRPAPRRDPRHAAGYWRRCSIRSGAAIRCSRR